MKAWICWGMYFVIVVYNFLNWYHTKMAFAVGIGEMNPLMASLNINQILIVKFIMVGLLGILLTTKHAKVKE